MIVTLSQGVFVLILLLEKVILVIEFIWLKSFEKEVLFLEYIDDDKISTTSKM